MIWLLFSLPLSPVPPYLQGILQTDQMIFMNIALFFLFLCLVNDTSLCLDHVFLHLGNLFFL